MSGYTLSATEIADDCGGASVLCTSPMSGSVAVLQRETAGGFAATAGFDDSWAVGTAKVSLGSAAATVPIGDGGADSAIMVSAPSRGGVPERCGWLGGADLEDYHELWEDEIAPDELGAGP